MRNPPRFLLLATVLGTGAVAASCQDAGSGEPPTDDSPPVTDGTETVADHVRALLAQGKVPEAMSPLVLSAKVPDVPVPTNHLVVDISSTAARVMDSHAGFITVDLPVEVDRSVSLIMYRV